MCDRVMGPSALSKLLDCWQAKTTLALAGASGWVNRQIALGLGLPSFPVLLFDL